jgi:Uma2 family endonuclease
MKLTEEQYLEIDRAAEFRNELLDGEIVETLGGNLRHATLRMNLMGSLYPVLRASSCQMFGCNLRVRVSSRTYTYPDLTVVCGEPMPSDDRQDILLNPTVIFEVLSPSTEKYDRGIKLQHYRSIESLQDYILVSQDQIRIEQYTRGAAHTWTLRDYQSLGETLLIESIGASLALARIYERIEFPPA